MSFMDLLALSGSLRSESSNTALLRAMQALAETLRKILEGLVLAVEARINSGSRP